MSSEPPSKRPTFGRRGLLAAVLKDAAPLDLRILGRVLLHATVVGAGAGAMACLFYYALELMTQLCVDVLTGYETLRASGELLDVDAHAPMQPRPWLLLVVPTVGALAAGVIVHKWAPECAGAGADATIRAFHQKVSEVRRRVMFIKPLATVLTLGTGGAGGREGPTMQIGGAIGSTVARLLNVSQRERRILLVAGMAAGTSAIFRTPLGAALLAVEVLYRDDFEADALIPAVLASVVGYSVFIGVYGESTLFETAAHYPFVVSHLPLYGLMTVVLGVAGRLFVKSLREMSQWATRWPAWLRPAIGGLGVGLLAFTFAVLTTREAGQSVLGGGYGLAQAAITGADWVGTGLSAAGLLALLAVVKLLAAALTVGTGGSAGAFGPTFAIGALLGGSFGQLAQYVVGDPAIDPGAFALVGMGALFGGIAHAPLGSLVMVCELCGSYDLLVPLMLAQGIAFVTLRRVSLYPAQNATQQDSPAHPPRVMEVLSRMKVKEVMKMPGPYVRFSLNTPVPEVLRKVGDCSWQDAFPVFDDSETIVGMITPDMLRVLAAERELEPWLLAADAMQTPVVVHADDDLRVASERMLTDGLREVIVVDDDGKIVGFVDEAEVGQVYLDFLN